MLFPNVVLAISNAVLQSVNFIVVNYVVKLYYACFRCFCAGRVCDYSHWELCFLRSQSCFCFDVPFVLCKYWILFSRPSNSFARASNSIVRVSNSIISVRILYYSCFEFVLPNKGHSFIQPG